MELDESLARNDNFHELFVKIDMCLKTLENELLNISLNNRPPSSADSETRNFSVASNPLKIKLPELNISKSDGDVTNWQTFLQQFESAIHLNDTLDNINKFNYLLQYLCEDAESTNKGLSLTSVNYIKGIDLLKQRNGNTQILISAYTKKLVLLPIIRGENDVQGLRLLHDQIECSMQNLRLLDVDIST